MIYFSNIKSFINNIFHPIKFEDTPNVEYVYDASWRGKVLKEIMIYLQLKNQTEQRDGLRWDISIVKPKMKMVILYLL
jgi:hypothetical protein